MDCRIKSGNDGIGDHSRDALASELLFKGHEKLPQTYGRHSKSPPKKRKGGEAPKGAPSTTAPSGAARPQAEDARLPALHRGSRQQPEGRLTQLQAMLPGTWIPRALPP